MSLQNFNFNSFTIHQVLSRRDIKSEETIVKKCTQNAAGNDFLKNICLVSAHYYSENKEKADSCMKDCKDEICSTDCLLKDSGFSLKEFTETPLIKAEEECKSDVNIDECAKDCKSNKDKNCLNDCVKSVKQKYFTCLSKKINVSEEQLEESESCIAKKCFGGSDLSNFKGCYEECTYGKTINKEDPKPKNQTEKDARTNEKPSTSNSNSLHITKSSCLTIVVTFFCLFGSFI